MKTDKGQFDEVLRRMLEAAPQKTAEIKAGNKIKPRLFIAAPEDLLGNNPGDPEHSRRRPRSLYS